MNEMIDYIKRVQRHPILFALRVSNPTFELTGLPPTSDTIVEPNPFDEKLAGGNSGPTTCYVSPWLGRMCLRCTAFTTSH